MFKKMSLIFIFLSLIQPALSIEVVYQGMQKGEYKNSGMKRHHTEWFFMYGYEYIEDAGKLVNKNFKKMIKDLTVWCGKRKYPKHVKKVYAVLEQIDVSIGGAGGLNGSGGNYYLGTMMTSNYVCLTKK